MTLVHARLLALLLAALASRAHAAPDDTLESELAAVTDALLEARFPKRSAKNEKPARGVDELEEVLSRAYEESAAGARAQAVARLIDALEGPRFRDFAELPPFAAAELLLASLLIEERALGRAERLIAKLTARGADTRTFGPAFQRGVDIALLRGDLDASADRLAALLPKAPPRDAADALHYLRGLAAHDDGLTAQARAQLTAVSRRSRFHPSARYLLGVIASAEGAYDEAMAHFREVCRRCDDPRAAHRVSPSLFALDDLAWLGLGRVAHEQRRDDVAFAHYFRVPNDSPKLADALFEAAWASYARGRQAVALDGLDQLEARFPGTVHADEARVLRGYVALAQGRFDEAVRMLADVERTLTARVADPSSLPLPSEPKRARIAAMERALHDARAASTRAGAKLRARVEALAHALGDARIAAETEARAELTRRLAQALRRARIARVDAIMGKKRALEDEIASLAAGRFPPELPRATAPEGLLRDDEEYWPFEGEAWDDERAESRR
ncbi:MAG: tetratricopeptide repeat protein [Polyangiales bacterium]